MVLRELYGWRSRADGTDGGLKWRDGVGSQGEGVNRSVGDCNRDKKVQRAAIKVMVATAV